MIRREPVLISTVTAMPGDRLTSFSSACDRARPAPCSSSQRQIAANRRNGAKSRGPCSQEGKARSRMNALRHCLAVKIAAIAENHSVGVGATYERLRQIE